jgi:RNA polymerase sigma factor (sigma-70 family)
LYLTKTTLLLNTNHEGQKKMELTLQWELNERSLIDACIARERWAQQRLYEEYYPKMMGVCMRYANNDDDALDILHEGFIKVFKHVASYQPGTSLTAWIRRIMVNTAIDYYRKTVRRRTEDIETAYNLSSSDADAISQCTEKDILAAVKKLTPAYRAVFNMYVIEGFSHKEIADQLEITESTSRSNLVKARLKLQAILTGRFDLDKNGNEE